MADKKDTKDDLEKNGFDDEKYEDSSSEDEPNMKSEDKKEEKKDEKEIVEKKKCQKGNRICTKCKVELPKEKFDGRIRTCKDCISKIDFKAPGRRSKLNDIEVAKQAAQLIASGATMAAISRIIGVPISTISFWHRQGRLNKYIEEKK
jgi:transposase-like protein